jgi:hypothetical protein
VGFSLANKADDYKRLVRFESNRIIYGLRLDYRSLDRILAGKD